MNKIFKITGLINFRAAVLCLSTVALVGCTLQEAENSRQGSNPAQTPDDIVAVHETPQNKNEASRTKPLEIYDSEDPDIYRPAADPAVKTITQANFDRIKIGMSYKEVVEIFGDEGVQTSTLKVNNRETTIFKWSVPDFSKYIDLHFENDKVIEKKQKGLF